MSIKIDDRQVVNRVALPALGTSANTTLDIILAAINTEIVTTIGTFDSQTSSVNGAVVSSNSIFFQSASASDPGMVNTGSQTFAGSKTFTGLTIFDAPPSLQAIFNSVNANGPYISFRNSNVEFAEIGAASNIITGGSNTDFGILSTHNIVFAPNTSTAALTLEQTSGNGLFSNQLGVGSINSNNLLSVGGGTNPLSGSSQRGIVSFMTGTSAGTSVLQGFLAAVTSGAAVTNVEHYVSSAPSATGGAITRFSGFYDAGAQTHVATDNASLTDNVGFSGNWFINQAGSDPSTLGGNLTLGLGKSLSLQGSSSGVISILPQATAGTFNFNLPITAGTTGQVLTSGGGGGSPMTWSTVSLATQPTVQRFDTPGTGTYTATAGALYVRIIGTGGGGGGGGSGNVAGTAATSGTSTTFSGATASGGAHGNFNGASGTGGSGTPGANPGFGVSGSDGGSSGTNGSSSAQLPGGNGGNSGNGGGGAYGGNGSGANGQSGNSGTANSGGGGGGGSIGTTASSGSGSGGGGGGYFEIILPASSATGLSYTVGSGGNGGGAGSNGSAGGNGGSGRIVFWEFYS